jgi:hypothetical protein
MAASRRIMLVDTGGRPFAAMAGAGAGDIEMMTAEQSQLVK